MNESQVEEYKRHNENVIMSMPDDRGGNMASVRNYILENLDCDIVMMDDDINYIGYYEKGEMKVLLEEETYKFFENNFRMVRELGTVLWGLNLLVDKIAYREYSPFSLSSVVLGPCLGIIKECDIKFDEKLGLKEDYDFSLQVLKRHRKLLRFNKYFYCAKHIGMSGGCASYRTKDKEIQQKKEFVKKWGNNIVQFKGDDINPIIHVPIKGI